MISCLRGHYTVSIKKYQIMGDNLLKFSLGFSEFSPFMHVLKKSTIIIVFEIPYIFLIKSIDHYPDRQI